MRQGSPRASCCPQSLSVCPFSSPRGLYCRSVMPCSGRWEYRNRGGGYRDLTTTTCGGRWRSKEGGSSSTVQKQGGGRESQKERNNRSTIPILGPLQFYFNPILKSSKKTKRKTKRTCHGVTCMMSRARARARAGARVRVRGAFLVLLLLLNPRRPGLRVSRLPLHSTSPLLDRVRAYLL